MRLLDVLGLLRAFAVHRTRAVLTLFGIVVGAASIVMLASLLRGAEEALVRTSQQAVDADLVRVRQEQPPLDQRLRTQQALSRRDAREFATMRALDGAQVGSEHEHATSAMWEGRKKRVHAISAAPSSLSLYRLRIERGRFLDADDVATRRRVCVVGHEVWTDLIKRGGLAERIELTIEGEVFLVVGSLENKPILGATTDTNIWNRRVIIPETTYDVLFSPEHAATRLYVRRRSVVTPLETLRAVVDAALLRRHLGVRNFKVLQNQSKGQDQLILDVVQILLVGAGVIALFVGGINIMNIMLVAVTERTREIGLRRALGATPRMILMQFLVESGSVALLGGLFGAGLGVLLSWLCAIAIGKVVDGFSFHAAWWSVAMSLGLSLLTGITFGLYPAYRAAHLNPVDALRTE